MCKKDFNFESNLAKHLSGPKHNRAEKLVAFTESVQHFKSNRTTATEPCPSSPMSIDRMPNEEINLKTERSISVSNTVEINDEEDHRTSNDYDDNNLIDEEFASGM